MKNFQVSGVDNKGNDITIYALVGYKRTTRTGPIDTGLSHLQCQHPT